MCNDEFSGQTVAYEHDPTIGSTADASATAGDVTHLELEQLRVVAACHRPHTRGGEPG